MTRETTLSLQKIFFFDVEVILISYFVFSSNNRDLYSIDRIYILIAFAEPKYLNFNFRSAILFHRFSLTRYYTFQEIHVHVYYLLMQMYQ